MELKKFFELDELARKEAEKYPKKRLFYKQLNYEQELKKIFDFLGIKVIFTSSMSLSIFESSYDLPRRVKLFYLYPFSLREYLYFKKDIFLATLTLKEIQKNQYNMDYLRYDYIFEDYIKGGILPQGTNVLKEPKILMCLPYRLLYRDYQDCIGELREDFLVQTLKSKGYI